MAQRDQQPSPTPYEAIVKGKDMPAYSLPESFKALVREMQGLGLDVKLILEREGEVTLKESKEDIRHKADELDLIFQVHPEEVSETIEVHHRWIEAQTVEEDEARQAARLFIACEGIVSAPESAHAIASAIREVKQAQAEGKRPTILFCLSGHGLLDLAFYAWTIQLGLAAAGLHWKG